MEKAGLKGMPLVGCASHRLDLAVHAFLESHEVVLKRIDAIMSKLKNLILGGKLRKLTNLRPKKRYEGRWSGTLDMLRRYKELEGFLPKLGSGEIDELMLTHLENVSVSHLLRDLNDIDSVTKAVQSRSTTISDVRALFDALIENFPIMEDYLKTDANIVHSSSFESGIVKFQTGKESDMTDGEKQATMMFKKISDSEESGVLHDKFIYGYSFYTTYIERL